MKRFLFLLLSLITVFSLISCGGGENEKYRVMVSVFRGAFMNSNLEELIIPKGTNLKILMNGCFKGASKLSRLVIYHENEEDILPPYDFLGVADGFTVFIPKDSDYDSGYYWGERGLRFERMEK